METKIKNWQLMLAFYGMLLWFISFQLTSILRDYGFEKTSITVFGYTVGVVTGFAGFAFYEILRGNVYKFIDDNFLFKPLSYFFLFLILSLGLYGIVSTNIISISIPYNLAVIIGGCVAGWGVIPVINHLNGG